MAPQQDTLGWVSHFLSGSSEGEEEELEQLAGKADLRALGGGEPPEKVDPGESAPPLSLGDRGTLPFAPCISETGEGQTTKYPEQCV